MSKNWDLNILLLFYYFLCVVCFQFVKVKIKTQLWQEEGGGEPPKVASFVWKI